MGASTSGGIAVDSSEEDVVLSMSPGETDDGPLSTSVESAEDDEDEEDGAVEEEGEVEEEVLAALLSESGVVSTEFELSSREGADTSSLCEDGSCGVSSARVATGKMNVAQNMKTNTNPAIFLTVEKRLPFIVNPPVFAIIRHIAENTQTL